MFKTLYQIWLKGAETGENYRGLWMSKDTFTENHYLQIQPPSCGRGRLTLREEPRARKTEPQQRNWHLAPGWTLEGLWTSDTCVPSALPFFKWESLWQLCYTYPTPVCQVRGGQVCGGQRGCPLSSQFIKVNGMVPKKLSPRRFTWGASPTSWPDVDDKLFKMTPISKEFLCFSRII